MGFEKRCLEFVEQAKQHPDLKSYFSQATEIAPVVWKSDPPKSFFEPIMRSLADKQDGKKYVSYFTRLKQQQNQWNSETLEQVLASFIKADKDEVKIDCLRQIHKRAYTSAEKLNMALLGDPNQTLDSENYGRLLKDRFPDVYSKITESQPDLPLNLEKSYSVTLLEGFIDALLPALSSEAEKEATRCSELIKEHNKSAQFANINSLQQQYQQAMSEFKHLDKRIKERGKQAVQAKVDEQSPHKMKPSANPFLIAPTEEKTVTSTSKLNILFNKLLKKGSGHIEQQPKVELPRTRSPSLYTPPLPVQSQDKELRKKLTRQRSKSEAKKVTPPSPSI